MSTSPTTTSESVREPLTYAAYIARLEWAPKLAYAKGVYAALHAGSALPVPTNDKGEPVDPASKWVVRVNAKVGAIVRREVKAAQPKQAKPTNTAPVTTATMTTETVNEWDAKLAALAASGTFTPDQIAVLKVLVQSTPMAVPAVVVADLNDGLATTQAAGVSKSGKPRTAKQLANDARLAAAGKARRDAQKAATVVHSLADIGQLPLAVSTPAPAVTVSHDGRQQVPTAGPITCPACGQGCKKLYAHMSATRANELAAGGVDGDHVDNPSLIVRVCSNCHELPDGENVLRAIGSRGAKVNA